jgi:hypothetical protein
MCKDYKPDWLGEKHDPSRCFRTLCYEKTKIESTEPDEENKKILSSKIESRKYTQIDRRLLVNGPWQETIEAWL